MKLSWRESSMVGCVVLAFGAALAGCAKVEESLEQARPFRPWSPRPSQAEAEPQPARKPLLKATIVIAGYVGTNDGQVHETGNASIRVTYRNNDQTNSRGWQQTFPVNEKTGAFSIEIPSCPAEPQKVRLLFTADGLDYTELKLPVPCYMTPLGPSDLPQVTIQGILSIHVQRSELIYEHDKIEI